MEKELAKWASRNKISKNRNVNYGVIFTALLWKQYCGFSYLFSSQRHRVFISQAAAAGERLRGTATRVGT